MDVNEFLSTLDFDSVGEWSADWDRPVTSLEHLQLFDELKEACRDKNLPAVIQTSTKLRQSNALTRDLRRPAGALHEAVKSGAEGILQYLLSGGVEIDANEVETATMMKAKSIIQLFLQHGWPINERLGWYKAPALAYAVEDEDLTAWFLDQGADPNAPCGLDITPLSAAVQHASLAVVQMLFASGGSIEHGQLLHFAVGRDLDGRADVVKYLLAMGAPVNAIMYQDKPDSCAQRQPFGLGTPLHGAAAQGDMDVIRILLGKGADPRIRDTRGHLAHERARGNGHSQATKYLVRQGWSFAAKIPDLPENVNGVPPKQGDGAG